MVLAGCWFFHTNGDKPKMALQWKILVIFSSTLLGMVPLCLGQCTACGSDEGTSHLSWQVAELRRHEEGQAAHTRQGLAEIKQLVKEKMCEAKGTDGEKQASDPTLCKYFMYLLYYRGHSGLIAIKTAI